MKIEDQLFTQTQPDLKYTHMHTHTHRVSAALALFLFLQPSEFKAFALVSLHLAGLFSSLNPNVMSSQRLSLTKVALSQSLTLINCFGA